MIGLFDDEDVQELQDDSFEQEVDAAAPPAPVEISPRSNPDLLGHEDVEKALLADFNAGRMPHAVILAGPEGIGKATFAYRLARFLLAQGPDQGAGLFGEPEKPASFNVASNNPVFHRVSSGGHADLKVVERELDEKKGRLKKDISVNSVREITPFLRKTAAENGWRAVIVDSAEYLNRSSQNALLKILEEPPSQSILILTTSQPGAFLPTIRSRCRMVHMDPLSQTVMGKLLDKFLPGITSAERSTLLGLSEGSIGKAMRFQAEGGVSVYKDLMKILSAMPDLPLVAVHDLADKIGRVGSEQSYETAREIMTGWCERIVRLHARGQDFTDVVPGDAEIFRRLASVHSPQTFLEIWEKMAQMFLQAEIYNLDKRQAIIAAFLMLQNPAYAVAAA